MEDEKLSEEEPKQIGIEVSVVELDKETNDLGGSDIQVIDLLDTDSGGRPFELSSSRPSGNFPVNNRVPGAAGRRRLLKPGTTQKVQ